MKIKHVSFIEQHIEKFILVVGLLLGLLVYWLYASGEPYTVDVGSRKDVTPDEVEQVVEQASKSLDAEIRSSENPLPALVVPEYTMLFRRRLDQSLNTGPDGKAIVRLDVPMADVGLGKDIIEPPSADDGMRPYFAAKPPAPTLKNVSSEHAVLGEIEQTDVREAYVTLVGEHEPMDFRYIAVEGEFDFAAWQQRLRASDMPAGYQAIPEEWWRDLMLLTTVVLERQAMEDNGQWGEVEQIAAIPNALSFRGMNRPLTAKEAQEIIRQIREEQPRIAEPQLPLAGLQEDETAGANLSPEDQEQLQRLNEQINRQQAELTRLNGGGRAGVARGTGGALEDPMAFDRPATSPSAKRAEAQLARLKQRRDELLGLSVDPRDGIPGNPGVATGRFGTMPDARRGRGGFALDDRVDSQNEESEDRPSTMSLKAYDLTADSSVTYRYRLRVEVVSPLFRRQLEPEQRQVYFHKVSLESDASAWTEPVRVEQEKEFFLVASNPPNVARFEVWTVFNGKRRKQNFDARPGDSVGEVVEMRADNVSSDVDLRLGVVLVDVDLSGAGGRGLTRALMYDPESDTMFERVLGVDRESERRQKLQQESVDVALPEPVALENQ